METINKKFVLDENENKVAVQIDIKEFERLERIIEDYALGKILDESLNDERVSLKDAKQFYDKLKIDD